MITASTYPTTLPRVSRGSGHFHISDPYKYCAELDLVIQVAKSKGYQLPTDYQLRCLNDLINELKSNTIFSRYDFLYVQGYGSLRSFILTNDGLAAGVLGTTKEHFTDTLEKFVGLNIVNPNRYELIRIPSSRPRIPYYNAKGWINVQGLASGSFNTQYVAGVNGVNWTQNNAGISVYSCDTTFYTSAANSVIIGDRDSVTGGVTRSSCSLIPSNGTHAQCQINSAGTTFNIANTDGRGFFRLERTASNLNTLYRNGVQLGTNTQASLAVTSIQPIYLMARNLDGVQNVSFGGGLSFASAGGALGSTLQKIEYELFTRFRTKLEFQ
jgi:hypothetical protein